MHPWRILLDQNVRYEVKELLTQTGIDAIHTVDAGLQRKTDPEILSFATESQRTLVTLDKDFGSQKIFPLPTPHFGVIRLKIVPALPKIVFDLLLPFLKNHKQEDIDSSLVIITKNKARIVR